MKVKRFKKAQDEPEQAKSQKEIETLLLQVIEQNIPFLSQTIVLGLALILIKANIGSKEELKNMKVATVINKLYPILKMIATDRQTIKQELRLLWRYGAQTYAARKNRELKSVVGA